MQKLSAEANACEAYKRENKGDEITNCTASIRVSDSLLHATAPSSSWQQLVSGTLLFMGDTKVTCIVTESQFDTAL